MQAAFRVRAKTQEEADKLIKYWEGFFKTQGYVPGDIVFYVDVTPRLYTERVKEIELMADISAGKVPDVLLPALDQIGKNLKELQVFVELCKEKKVQIVSLEEHIDTDKTGYLFRLEDIIRYQAKRQGMDTSLSFANSSKQLGRPKGSKDNPKSKRQIQKRKRLENKLKELNYYKETFKGKDSKEAVEVKE